MRQETVKTEERGREKVREEETEGVNAATSLLVTHGDPETQRERSKRRES